MLFNRWAYSANAVSPGSNEVMVETAVFRLSGVTRRYGDLVALEDVSLDVGVNEYVSFLGPSGSGKTTLLRVIAGFEAPDAGRVFFEGRDITHLPAHERGVGFVFQNFALFPHLTVAANVSFGLHRLWKHFAIQMADVKPGQSVLDVASGSGDLALGRC